MIRKFYELGGIEGVGDPIPIETIKIEVNRNTKAVHFSVSTGITLPEAFGYLKLYATVLENEFTKTGVKYSKIIKDAGEPKN